MLRFNQPPIRVQSMQFTSHMQKFYCNAQFFYIVLKTRRRYIYPRKILCNAQKAKGAYRSTPMSNVILINLMSAALMAAIFFVLPKKMTPAVRILSAFSAGFLVVTLVQSGATLS
ncbi:MAG TPA: hypothetical protein DCS82_01190 [Rhodospirillaceae bacterium]|nr:hypothetical protein [Rhodospirillaceae bacterium]HAA91100.1 hypothetical protein [Rhodospirillaceae bacterium]HAT34304.1 hypothetical protein [Rhodospirillaceae bacterium]